ncbi:MAG: aspartyl protease family protein [Candidatus Edwardsbacteria bacterium]
MGETFAEVIIRANGREVKKKLLVDTGSTYSWLKPEVAKQVGIKPIEKREFETIEGRIVKRRIGFVEMRVLDRRTPTLVILGLKKDSEVLGLHALEGLGLEVDPINRRLKKSRAIKAL